MPPLTTKPRPRRSQSVTDFPPPMRRSSTEFTGAPRPVSFSAKFHRVHPATTGVTVLEHMERLDAVEAGLKRIGVEEDPIEEVDEEEMDVGMMRPKGKKQKEPEAAAEPLVSPSARSDRLPAVMEDEVEEDRASITEEDLVALSKSMPHLESPSPVHARWTSVDERPTLDWMDIDAANNQKRRLVIAEVCIPVIFPV